MKIDLDTMLPLSKAERDLIEDALDDYIGYLSVTDRDGVRESKANQRKIAALRELLARLRTSPHLK